MNMTNKQKVLNFLKESGASSVEEIVQGTSLEKKKVRNVVSADYSANFVYVGGGKYDLAGNALRGVKFRYRPQKEEIEEGFLSGSSSIVDFLFFGRYDTSINLIDEKGRNYLIKYKVKKGRKLEKIESKISPLRKFFRNNRIDQTHILLFSILDFEKRQVRVENILEKKANLLRKANKHIADLLYQFLKTSRRKNDFLLFLNRRILPFYKNTDVAAELPEEILSKDKRFILYDFYSKKAIKNDFRGRNIGAGIRKYSVVLPNGELSWAAIEKDNYGRYGFCEHCGIPLFWHRRNGWYHPEEDVMEFEVFREDVELDREFFKRE